MVEYACTCSDGFGIDHSHCRDHVTIERNGQRYGEMVENGWVRIWVDWKKVARALMAS